MIIDGKTLDEEQVDIVKTKESFLAISGAGAGKTLSIVAKVKYMVDNGVDPKDILIIAYTRLSAKEVEERCNKVGVKIKVYTFHSLAFKYNMTKNLITIEEYEAFNKHFFIKDKERAKLLEEIYKESEDKNLAKAMYEKDLLSLASVVRVNDYDISNFRSLSKYDKITKRLLKEYLEEYEAYKRYHQIIDYDDMIKNAIGKVSRKYEYVIVDEFQDISLIRFNLLMSIVRSSNAKLYAFGDDYQAIYGFSGSKVSFFSEFEKYSGISTKKFITKTYRNSMELIDIATKFVMKNKKQIKKNLHSDKSLANPVEIIYKDTKEAFKYIYSEVSEDKSILVLSRYSFNIRVLKELGLKYLSNDTYLLDGREIKFLTVHKAKGLEADYVVVLEMINDTYGFPTKLKTSRFLRKINDYKEIKYAEERRLFYVALTRTKNKVYLLTDKTNESLFIKEIKKYDQVKLVK